MGGRRVAAPAVQPHLDPFGPPRRRSGNSIDHRDRHEDSAAPREATASRAPAGTGVPEADAMMIVARQIRIGFPRPRPAIYRTSRAAILPSTASSRSYGWAVLEGCSPVGRPCRRPPLVASRACAAETTSATKHPRPANGARNLRDAAGHSHRGGQLAASVRRANIGLLQLRRCRWQGGLDEVDRCVELVVYVGEPIFDLI
jgi:hypothetical protein